MSELKKQVLSALEGVNKDELANLLRDHPGSVRFLVNGLHTSDEDRLDRVLDGFRTAADVLDEEKRLDLARRLMWLLNEESGNNCPNAALALAAMAEIHPDSIKPHLPVLRVYADDPSDYLSTACRKAVAIIKQAINEPD